MEDFVPFELTKKLNEKGFNAEFKYSLGYYDTLGNFMSAADHWFLDSWIIAPTIAQVLKWLRKEKRIEAGAIWDNRDDKWVGYVNEMDMPDLVGEYVLANTYDFYELASIAVIEYIIDNNLI